jgi:hypothetical protein
MLLHLAQRAILGWRSEPELTPGRGARSSWIVGPGRMRRALVLAAWIVELAPAIAAAQARPTPVAGRAALAVHAPPSEQAIFTPVPIYLEPATGQRFARVMLRYKPFGATRYKSIEMKPLGQGFGVEIPWEDVSTTGDVRYFFAFIDENGDVIGSLGSSYEPFVVTIKHEIEGPPPALPGRDPPQRPPEAKAYVEPYRDKSYPHGCEDDRECNTGLRCIEWWCVTPQEIAREAAERAAKERREREARAKKNLVALGAQIDLAMLPAGDGGVTFAHVRALLGYDRLLSARVPITAGVRAGVAFPFAPSDEGERRGRGFVPVHLETRLGYSFLGALERAALRPYVFLSGGLAPMAPRSRATTLGPSFVATGGGLIYGLTERFGLSVELKGMLMLPAFAFVLAPNAGPVVAF